MDTLIIILMVIAGIFAGFFSGYLFRKRSGRKGKIVGNIIITNSDSESESAYVFLELFEEIETLNSRKTVMLNVKHVSHK